jgi:hypothetical protein
MISQDLTALRNATMAALGDDRRATVMAARGRGCDLDRWQASDRAILAREVTRLEDRIELEQTSSRRRERLAELRRVRRALEDSDPASRAAPPRPRSRSGSRSAAT